MKVSEGTGAKERILAQREWKWRARKGYGRLRGTVRKKECEKVGIGTFMGEGGYRTVMFGKGGLGKGTIR